MPKTKVTEHPTSSKMTLNYDDLTNLLPVLRLVEEAQTSASAQIALGQIFLEGQYGIKANQDSADRLFRQASLSETLTQTEQHTLTQMGYPPIPQSKLSILAEVASNSPRHSASPQATALSPNASSPSSTGSQSPKTHTPSPTPNNLSSELNDDPHGSQEGVAAYVYYLGKSGIKIDYTKARYLANNAFKKGSVDGAEVLALLHKDGLGGCEVNLTKSCVLFERIALLSPSAAFWLGRHWHTKHPNSTVAKAYLALAASCSSSFLWENKLFLKSKGYSLKRMRDYKPREVLSQLSLTEKDKEYFNALLARNFEHIALMHEQGKITGWVQRAIAKAHRQMITDLPFMDMPIETNLTTLENMTPSLSTSQPSPTAMPLSLSLAIQSTSLSLSSSSSSAPESSDHALSFPLTETSTLAQFKLAFNQKHYAVVVNSLRALFVSIKLRKPSLSIQDRNDMVEKATLLVQAMGAQQNSLKSIAQREPSVSKLSTKASIDNYKGLTDPEYKRLADSQKRLPSKIFHLLERANQGRSLHQYEVAQWYYGQREKHADNFEIAYLYAKAAETRGFHEANMIIGQYLLHRFAMTHAPTDLTQAQTAFQQANINRIGGHENHVEAIYYQAICHKKFGEINRAYTLFEQVEKLFLRYNAKKNNSTKQLKELSLRAEFYAKAQQQIILLKAILSPEPATTQPHAQETAPSLLTAFSHRSTQNGASSLSKLSNEQNGTIPPPSERSGSHPRAIRCE